MRAKLAWALLLVAALLPVAGLPVAAEDRAPISITDIRQESTDRSTRLTVECSAPVAYATFSPDPLTLVVDIPEADTSKVPARINVGTREVESLRVTTLGRADGRSMARLEVHLASLVPFKVFSKDKALNLVFERGGQAAAPGDAPAAAPAAAAEAPAPAPGPETAEVAPAPAPKPKPEPVAPAPVVGKGPASTILGVSQSMDSGQLAITVQANGSLRYQDFFLGNPDRLVIDFKDVVTRAPKGLDVEQGPVRKVRIGQFSVASPKVARLVLDLSARSPYHIVEARDGVKILFGDGGRTTSPAPLAALRTEPEPIVTAAAMPGPVVVPAPALPPPAAMPLPALPAPQEPPKESFDAKTLGSGQKVYTGHPISMDFKDADVQDIFRLFADISGLNVVVNPGVTGKVTLKLTEVPWDQALDLILKTNGLGKTIDDNVIRIARLSDLQKEEEDLRKLKENQALAGDLTTWRKSLSYAKAGDLQAAVTKVALSARGTITLDTRTNTMIITDLPAYIDRAKDLINDLDRATKQVEIEARIVVTTRNFTRDLGIQWGFSQRQTAEFGNTTDKTFPHSIILNGQGTPSQQGLPADQGALGTGASATGTTGRGYAVNLPASSFNSSIGISLGNILGNFNLDAALTALEKQGRGRILSTPKITTQNNQAAEIKQGVQIPLQTIANNTVTVQFKDAVLTLRVTPQITEADTVILALEVENNTADFANEVNGIPPINTQSAKTIVLVRDGATSVIGGIYQSNEQTAQSSTPFLGKLPLLGYLFRNRFVSTSNNELLLFITPRIVKG